MLPSKRNIGAQVTYGTEGVPLFIGSNKFLDCWKFPKQYGREKYITPIDTSFSKILESQRNDLQVINHRDQEMNSDSAKHNKSSNSRNIDNDISSNDDIPVRRYNTEIDDDNSYYFDKEVVEAQKFEAFKKIGNDAIDPSIGNKISYTHLTLGSKIYTILVSQAGSAGTIATFSILHKSDTQDVTCPPMPKYSCSVDLKQEIKQIIFSIRSNLEEALNPNICAIMTSTKIYFFKLKLVHKTHLSLKKLKPISSSRIANHEFSSMTFCPYDERLFCAIDIKGNFALFTISKLCTKKIKSQNKTIHDPADLSRFKKVIWGSHSGSLIFITRLNVFQYDINRDIIKCAVKAGAWSKIVDIGRPLGAESYCFMLTTQEIILVNLENFKKIISWKHYLNSKDLTFSLSFITHLSKDYNNEIDQITCIINSRAINFTYFIGFEIGESPSILTKPHYRIPHPTSSIESLCVVPIADDISNFNWYQLTSSLELSCYNIKIENYFEESYFTSYDKSLDDLKFKDGVIKGNTKKFYNFLNNYIMKNFKDLSKSKDFDGIEGDMIQNYALKLGEKLNSVEMSKQSTVSRYNIFDICEVPLFIHNVGELESMLQQFKSHYENYGYIFSFNNSRIFSDVGRISENLDFSKLTDGLFEFFSLLEPLKCENEGVLSGSIVQKLILSLISFRKGVNEKSISKDLDHARNLLSDEAKDIVDDWDETYEVVDDKLSISRYESYSQFDSTLPSIILTQSPKKKSAQRSSQGKRNILSQISQKKDQLNLSLSKMQPSYREEVPFSQSTPLGSITPSQIKRTGDSQQKLSSQRKRQKRKSGGFL
ncbi:hypothetical protein B5S28_g2148 [[Candida] boidinii]|nr:hypothetical protein B5S28_g2148 [[Candida] boidinii]OWB60345.1 hypothetical protein B5S29_g1218 [[Candida] boidinii]OWB72617.1 hypothetical protein B5S31_g2334 [[Candida] boidinii]